VGRSLHVYRVGERDGERRDGADDFPHRDWTESLTPEVRPYPPPRPFLYRPCRRVGSFRTGERREGHVRFQSQEVFRYQVEVLDRFGDPVTLLEAEGNG
jgi:hypothetical protein